MQTNAICTTRNLFKFMQMTCAQKGPWKLHYLLTIMFVFHAQYRKLFHNTAHYNELFIHLYVLLLVIIFEMKGKVMLTGAMSCRHKS